MHHRCSKVLTVTLSDGVCQQMSGVTEYSWMRERERERWRDGERQQASSLSYDMLQCHLRKANNANNVEKCINSPKQEQKDIIRKFHAAEKRREMLDLAHLEDLNICNPFYFHKVTFRRWSNTAQQ